MRDTLYPEMQKVPLVREFDLTDGEIEMLVQKAGEFEYDNGLSRKDANKAAISLVLELRS